MGCGPAADPSKDKNKPTTMIPASAPSHDAKPAEVKKEEKPAESRPEVAKAESPKKVEPAQPAPQEQIIKPPPPVAPPVVPVDVLKPIEEQSKPKGPENAPAPLIDVEAMTKPIQVNLENLKKESQDVVNEAPKVLEEVKKEVVKEVAKDPMKVLADLGYKLPQAQMEEDSEEAHVVHSMMYASSVRATGPSKQIKPTSMVADGMEPVMSDIKKELGQKGVTVEQGQVKMDLGSVKKAMGVESVGQPKIEA